MGNEKTLRDIPEVITLLLASLVVVLFLFAGCTANVDKEITNLESFTMYLQNGYLSCDFEACVIRCSTIEPDVDDEITITAQDAAQYKEFMTALCQEMIYNEEEYNHYPSSDAMVKTIWWIEIYYNDGCTKVIDVTEYAKRTYPDCWDEFVQRTNELTGCDINELLIDPYDVPQKEIEELQAATVFLSNGLVCFNYTDNQIEYYKWGTDIEIVIDLTPEEIAESREFMQQFCEDMLAHSDEYSGYPSETELKEYWQLRVIYDSENTVKQRDIYITEGGERMYPDNWDEFVQLVYELTSRDVTELSAVAG